MIFGSPRQALAYLYAHHRGPAPARMRWHDAPPDTGRSHWDGSEVGALLYGPRKLGCCGVVHGSALDRELQHWAANPGAFRSDQIRAIDRRMRILLRRHKLLAASHRVPKVRHWTDEDGVQWGRLARSTEPSANTRCADGLNVAEIP